MKNIKKIAMYGVILAISIGAIMLVKNKVDSKETSKAVPVKREISVKVQQAKTVEKNAGSTYKATLEPYEEGAVTSKVGGKVVQVLFENGKSVSKGDTLVILDDKDIRNQLKSSESQLQIAQNQLAASEVTLQKIQINLENAQRNYDRTKSLVEEGAVPEINLENAEIALKNAQSDYNSGQSSIEISKANIEMTRTSMSILQDSLENMVIKAPISGVISDKGVQIGQMASPGLMLAKVNDISSVYATIQVEQENIKNIKTGQKAILKINDEEDKSYDGVVKVIDSLANSTSRVFNCKIQVANGEKLLNPGVFGKVQIISDEKINTIVIPIESLAGNEGQYYVFVNENGIAKKRKVTIGDTEKNIVEIKTGLKDGENVVCTNISTLQDGDKIKVASK